MTDHSSVESHDVEELYRKVGNRIWRAVLAYSGSRDIASDATAEAFAQAIAGARNIRNMEAWVWTVAFHIARGELKMRQDYLPVSESISPEPVDRLDLLTGIRRLSPKERACLLLYYYGDFPIKQVATIVRSSPTSVRVHLSRGRRKLREYLGGEDANRDQ